MRRAKSVLFGLLGVAMLAALFLVGFHWQRWYSVLAGNEAAGEEGKEDEVSALPAPLDSPAGGRQTPPREDDLLWCRIAPAGEKGAEGGPEILVELTNISDDPVEIFYPPHKPTDHVIWEVAAGSEEMNAPGPWLGASSYAWCATPSVLRIEAGRTFSDKVSLARVLATQRKPVVPGTYRVRASYVRAPGVVARSEAIEVTLAVGAR
jgi:hypothetical protein